MKRWLCVPIAVALVGISTVAHVSTVCACSCTNDRTVLQEFDAAVAVFGGTVTSLVSQGEEFNLLAVFTPTIRWKGPLDPLAHVYTPPNEGVCGFPFEISESYLVFAFSATVDGHPAFFTHLCSRNGPLANHPAISQLPPPLQPVSTQSGTWGALKVIYR